MALFLYPNIGGLEMVLFFFLNFTVAKKIFKTRSLEASQSSPRLQKSEETRLRYRWGLIQYKHL